MIVKALLGKAAVPDDSPFTTGQVGLLGTRPSSVGMQYFFQLNTAWGEVMAYATMITLPVLVVFFLFQRTFVTSISASGLKG